LSAWYWQLGDLPRSLQVIEEAIRAVPGDLGVGAEHLGYSPYIWLVMNRGRLLPWLGRCAEAAEACDRAIELASEHSEREILVWAHQGHVDCAWLSGDATLAMPHARAAAELAERLGTALVRWSSAYSLGRAHLLSGDPAAARSALEESLGIIRDTRTGLHGEILVLGALAEAHLGSGNLERTSARATEAVELSRRDRQRPGGIAARIVLARVLVRTGDAGGAKLCIDEATQMLGAETTPMLEPFVRVQRAEVALASGDAEGHDRELAAARELFIRMGAGTRAEQLERSPAGG
jgi:ATP/maltotriose-dependent transcriptional regulator MalT